MNYKFLLLQLILPYRRYEADQVSAMYIWGEAYEYFWFCC